MLRAYAGGVSILLNLSINAWLRSIRLDMASSIVLASASTFSLVIYALVFASIRSGSLWTGFGGKFEAVVLLIGFSYFF